MSDERKPQGEWTKRDDETFWRLSTHPHSYKIVAAGSGFLVTEFDADGIDRSRDDFEEPFATLEAAQLAVEDDVRERAESNLRLIGRPPLGEVIRDLNRKKYDGFCLRLDGTGPRGELFQASALHRRNHGEWETLGSSLNHHGDPDRAIREIASNLDRVAERKASRGQTT